MRIAIVNKFFFLKGGQETVALEQMRLLQNAGHEVAYFSMRHPQNPAGYEWERFFVDHADFSLKESKPGLLQKLSLAGRFVVNPQAAQRFQTFLEAFKPDVIHCHGIAHQLTYSILPVAQRFGIPVVQTLHDYQIICPNYTLLKGDQSICQDGCTTLNYLPCVQNSCVKGSRAASLLSAMDMVYNRSVFDYTRLVKQFVSPSRFLADKVVAHGLPAERMRHIPNFLVNLEQYPVSSGAGEYFLYIGRLSYEKGLMTLLKAFVAVPEAKLVIVGDGPLRAELTGFCDRQGLQNVHFAGHVDRDGVSRLIQDARSVILPSEWYENQPMSIIEAFAHARPVIASRIGGIPEMISENCGFLFPPGDADALADLVRQALAHPTQMTEMGQNARHFAINTYHSDIHLAHLATLYASIMAP